MIAKSFSTRKQAIDVDLIFLLIRIIFGCAFILHGWGKIHAPFAWMGKDSAVPGLLQALAALAEFGGGAAIVVGLLTRLAAFGIACNMAVAVCLLHFSFGSPFVSQTGGLALELPAIYFAIALLLLFQGAGRFSLDRLTFG